MFFSLLSREVRATPVPCCHGQRFFVTVHVKTWHLCHKWVLRHSVRPLAISLSPMLPAQDFQRVWQALGARDAERLTLVWETQELLALNFSIVTFLKDQVASISSIKQPAQYSACALLAGCSCTI